jgi:hypothetical protein
MDGTRKSTDFKSSNADARSGLHLKVFQIEEQCECQSRSMKMKMSIVNVSAKSVIDSKMDV